MQEVVRLVKIHGLLFRSPHLCIEVLDELFYIQCWTPVVRLPLSH